MEAPVNKTNAQLKLTIPSIFIRILKWTGLLVLILLTLLFLAPYVFPETVSQKIKGFANSKIKGQLDFKDARLSFFKHFPSFTFTLNDFSLKGSAPYAQDTLIAADEISLGINLKSLLFEKKININKIFLARARIAIKVNEQGFANYNILGSDSTQPGNTAADSGTALMLEKIIITNSRLIYNDLSAPLLIDAMGLNYTGKGDLSKDLFDLDSHLNIDSINFHLNNSDYFLHKKINADLVTRINTNSLDFFFEKNDLKINQLRLQFNGRFSFLKNGYFFDISLQSHESDLHDFVTALPPQYISWLERTTLSGAADLHAAFRGQYIASTSSMPSFSCSARIRDGFVSYDKAPFPVSRAFLDFEMKLPSLNKDSLLIKMDSFSFHIDKGYAQGHWLTVGLEKPMIAIKAKCRLDLEKLDRAIGLGSVRLKGNLNLDLEANGKYETTLDHEGIRQTEYTRTLSIPKFLFKADLTNGYIKYDQLPESIHDIRLSVQTSCPDNNYKHIIAKIDTMGIHFAKSFIHGSAQFVASPDFPMDARLQTEINLDDISKSFPLDSLGLSGFLNLTLTANGKYDPKKNLVPIVRANVNLKDGRIQTKYYPHPVERINLSLNALDERGNLNGLAINLKPGSFQFEGKPFELIASIQDLEDPQYSFKAKGEIDLEKLYKVFGKTKMNISGLIKADLSLRGRQSEALKGQYARLKNSGSLACKHLLLSHDYFAQPFLIREGVFSFEEDKMWFTNFQASYGQSDLKLDGYLVNAINYLLSDKEKLVGNFNLSAHFINLDEFSSFAVADTSLKNAGKKPGYDSLAKSTGVIMIPPSLDLTINANADKIRLNDIDLNDLSGGTVIRNGQILLTETSFNLIGCHVLMDGLYGNTSPTKAYFEYHLQAKDFDVKRAYREIRLFHDLASSAGKAEGIVSLDYHLKGKLNGQMYPVYPSLDGEGVLSIKNVKVNGLKLFNVVSSKTEKQELKDPELSKINIHSKIRNNIIYIDRFKFKTAGFRIRVEGQTSFDNKINFKIRVGLPPLGIIGIPVSATGYAENPQIKLGKNDSAALSETEDKEDEN